MYFNIHCVINLTLEVTMINFTRKEYLLNTANTITPTSLVLIKDIAELKGRLSHYLNQQNEYLNKLQLDTIINNTMASNYIDGLLIDNKTFTELFQELIEPSNDLQCEFLRYVKVLNTINNHYENLDLTPETILQFHRNLFAYKEDNGGYWRTTDQVVDNFISNQNFTNTENIQKNITELCNNYNQLILDPMLVDLVVISSFLFDFISIMPFDKGNGRLIRLINQLLLYKQGYSVVKYISVDQVIKDYYSRYHYSLITSLNESQNNTGNIALWVECFLWIIYSTYSRLDDLISPLSHKKGAKTQQVKIVLETMKTTFKVSDIAEKCPGISRPTINKVLQELRNEGKINPLSMGRDAVWQKVN